MIFIKIGNGTEKVVDCYERSMEPIYLGKVRISHMAREHLLVTH